jgi:hypothetical protein
MRDTLGINKVRVLFAWSDEVQPTPSSKKFVGFYDEIVNSAPSGVDLVVVVAHTPSWMIDPANWTSSDPRQMWVEEWFEPIVKRYAGHPNIVGWEIWNEPDLTRTGGDVVLGLEEPENYFNMLMPAANAVRLYDPGKLVVLAASMTIVENFPNNLIYNERLRDLGARDVVDVWNIHYYGMNLAQLHASGGVAGFLNNLGKVIWITESGRAGPTSQVDYVERMWPHLWETVPSIERIYYYEFASNSPVQESFGLRNNDPEFPVSDLYLSLRGY